MEKLSHHKDYAFITLILFWCGLAILSSMYVTIPLTGMFTMYFNISTNQATWIGSVFSLCYALGCLIYGPFSDKHGRKIFLVCSISLLTIVTLLISLVPNFSGLIFLRAFQGIIAAAFAPISFVYAAETFPAHKRVTALGFISSGLLMASVAGQVFSSVINRLFGWHAIFSMLGGLYLVSSVLVILFLPKDDLPRAKESVWLKFKQMPNLFKQKQLNFIFFITFTLLLTLVGMYTLLGSYLSSPKWGLTDQQVLLIRAAGIVGMLLSPFAGRFAMKMGTEFILRGGLVIAIIGLIGLGLSPSVVLMVISSVIYVAGIAIVTPITISLINQLGGASRGSAVSFNAFILFLGASSGPVLAVCLISTGHFRLAFESLASMLVIGLGVSMFIRSKKSAATSVEVNEASVKETTI
ncbi:MFS transporter [Priestia aryabhattai]|uniref:MFS transporter n=1 Tax=Priestia megaterium TaxID=1404 RepID=UPI0039B9B40D